MKLTKLKVTVALCACLLLTACGNEGNVADVSEPSALPESADAATDSVIWESADTDPVLVPENADPVKDHTYSVVQVTSGDTAGCGVIVKRTEEKLWIATVAHIFTDQQAEVRITFPEGQIVSGSVYIYDAARDVALVRTDPKEVPEESYTLAEGTLPDASKTDATVCAGLTTDRNLPVILLDTSFKMEEDIEGFPKETVIIAAGQIHQGMSGGGLFDESGHLLGIISGGTTEATIVAIPWRIYEEYLSHVDSYQ
ncbi:MAG: serine protease [Lachnospiraceae bacterium]|nr:serine protease [Lachnospiraceae bacterium]